MINIGGFNSSGGLLVFGTIKFEKKICKISKNSSKIIFFCENALFCDKNNIKKVRMNFFKPTPVLMGSSKLILLPSKLHFIWILNHAIFTKKSIKITIKIPITITFHIIGLICIKFENCYTWLNKFALQKRNNHITKNFLHKVIYLKSPFSCK